MSDFCNFKRTTARKAHRCPECNDVIQPGNVYVRIAGYSLDSGFFSEIQCGPCRAFGKRFQASLDRSGFLNNDEKAYSFGSMLEEAGEHLGYWRNAPKHDDWPAHRSAMLGQFDGFDKAELLYQARRRHPRPKLPSKHLAALYSRALVLGMASCSAAPAPQPTEVALPAPLSLDGGR